MAGSSLVQSMVHDHFYCGLYKTQTGKQEIAQRKKNERC
jgi:hypothetical protein